MNELMDKKIFQTYMQSFSFILDLYMIDGRTLIVVWKHPNKKSSIDGYQLPGRKPLFQNLSVEGLPMGAVDDNLVIGDFDEDAGTATIRLYPLEVDR